MVEVPVAERPREIKIDLEQSGSDISEVHPDFMEQQEVLVPLGTRFRLVSRQTVPEDGVEVTKIHLREVRKRAGDASASGGPAAQRPRPSSSDGAGPSSSGGAGGNKNQ